MHLSKRLLILLIVFSLSVFADNIDDGLSYLYSLQNADGSWGNNSLNKFLYTSEVLKTLQILNEKSANYKRGLRWLESQFPENVDFLSRKLSLLGKVSSNSKELVNKIISCQNKNGGFGIAKGFESDVFHTIIALDGLSSIFDTTNLCVTNALNYLIINQNSDGSYSFIKGSSGSVFTTSLALLVLSRYSGKPEVNNAIEKGVSYLISRMNSDSGFGEGESSIYETALVLQSLIKVSRRSDVREILKNYLAKRQLANGSWNNDIYETALALRVFHFITLPDLVISSISFEPQMINEGDTVKVISTITNIGEEVAQNITLRLYEDGVKLQDIMLNEISIGDTVNVAFLWNTLGKIGYHKIGVRIDPANLIEELEKDNNYLERMAFIQDTVPPESLDIYVQNPYFSPNGDGIKDISSVYFTASENVTVDVNVTDKNGEVVRNLAKSEFYSPGTYSLDWDGKNDKKELLPDGDYVYNVILEDRGGNIERRSHFVVIDRNKTPIFESLEPNRIYIKKVMWDYPEGSKRFLDYYPEQDYCFLIFQNVINKKYRDLILSNGLREYFDKLCEVDVGSPYGGIFDFQYSNPYRKAFFNTRGSPLLCFDLRKNRLDTIPIINLGSWYTYQISPKDDKILYYSDSKLFLTNFDGSSSKLVDSNVEIMAKSWSPDGNLFIYYKLDSSAIFLADKELHTKREIWKASYEEILWNWKWEWSPDGSHLAFLKGKYIGYEDTLTRIPYVIYEVLVFDILTNSTKVVATFKGAFIGEGGYYSVLKGPKWHPDGRTILVLWISWGGGEDEGEKISDKKPGLYEIDIETDSVKLLSDNDYYEEFQYVYNGTLILYGKYDDSGYNLYCIDRNGKNKRLVSRLPEWYGRTFFSKDEVFFLWGDEYVGINLDNFTVELSLQRLPETPNQLTLSGIISDRTLDNYVLSYGEGRNPSSYTTFYSNSKPVLNEIITNWTPPYTGDFTIRLQAFDKAGNFKEVKKYIDWRWNSMITNLRAQPEIFSPGSSVFADSTVITYTILKGEPLTFNIVDSTGKVVFSKNMVHPVPGEYSFVWKGINNVGSFVKDGLYSIRAYGCAISVITDTKPPEALLNLDFEREEFVQDNTVNIEVNGMVKDINFKDFTIYFAYKDTNNYLPIISSSYPVPRKERITRLMNLKKLGTYYAKLVAKDYIGYVTTIIDSILIDSFYVYGDVSIKKGKLNSMRSEARTRYSDVDSVVFSINGKRQGLGIREGENYYYNVDFVELYPPVPDKITFKGEVWYGNGGYDTDSYTIGVSLGGGGDGGGGGGGGGGKGSVSLLIVKPRHPEKDEPVPILSKVSDVEANFWMKTYWCPKFLQWVKFQYAPRGYPHYLDFGEIDYTPPFEQCWNTYLLPNGFYLLKAIGLDTLGKIWEDTLTVRVMNNPIKINLANKKGYWVSGIDTLLAMVIKDTVIAGNITGVKFYYILGRDTTFISEVYTSPYNVKFNTSILPDTQIFYIAYGYDNIGNKCWSNSLESRVDNTGPMIDITYPLSGLSFTDPDTILIEGIASDKNIKRISVKYRSSYDTSKVTLKESNENLVGTIAVLNAKALPTGDYKVFVFAEDQAGNLSSDSVQFTITNSPIPYVCILEPLNNSFKKGNVEVLYTVSDDNLYYYKLAFGMGKNPSDYSILDSANVSVHNKKYLLTESLIQKDTLYSLLLYAKDLTDKENKAQIFFTIDNTSPEVVIKYPQDYEKINKKFSIIGTVLDKNLKADTLFVGFGEKPLLWTVLKTGTKSLNNDTILVWNPFRGSDVYTFRLIAVDLAGNRAEDSVTVYLDTIPPAPPTGLVAKDNRGIVELSWNPNTEDDLEGYYLHRQGIKLNTRPFLNTSYIDTLPPVEGRYYYHLTAVDHLGNESKQSDTASVEVDLSPPFVKIISPLNNQWIRGVDTVMGIITDKNFLEYNLEYAPVLDMTYSLLITGLSDIPYGEIYKWDVSKLDGKYHLRLRGEDTYGNCDTFEIVVRVDNTPPILPDSLIATPKGSRVNLSWLPATDDHLAGYYIYRNGEKAKASIITKTSSVDTVFDGEYSYLVIAVDSAGNISEPAGPKSVVVDTRAPSVTIISPKEGSRVNGIIDIITQCQDKDLSSVLFRYKKDGGTWKDIKVVTSPPFTTQFGIDSLLDGKYYLSAVGTDIKGNTDKSPPSIYIFKVEDLTPPATPEGLVCKVEPIPAHKGKVTLFWKRNTEDDLEGYNIYRGGSKISSVVDTFFTEILNDNNYYRYNVSAVDTASNESSLSDSVVADLVPPELFIHSPAWNIYRGIIPIIITATDENFSSYSLLYKINADPSLHLLYQDTVEVRNRTVYRWNTKNINDTITLILTGRDKNGFTDTTAVEIIVDNLAPPPPESLYAHCLSEYRSPPIERDSIVLEWLPVTTEEVAYNIYYSTVSRTGYVKLNKQLVFNNRYVTVLPGGKTYYFVVTAVDYAGNESNYSMEASVSPLPGDVDIVVSDNDIWNFPSSLLEGDSVFTVVRVHNLGKISADNFSLKLMIEHKGNYITLNEWYVPSLSPGATSEFSFKWSTKGLAGQNVLHLLADPEDFIKEIDESNNWYSCPIEIRETDLLFTYHLSNSLLLPFTDLTAYYSIVNTGAKKKDITLSLSVLNSDSIIISRDFDLEHIVYDSLPYSSYGSFFYDTTNPRFGEVCITDSGGPGIHYFGFSASYPITELADSYYIIQYVYLDTLNPPSEIMLQFEDKYGGKDHRAFWGSDLINRGISGTSSRRNLGALPEKGKWARLTISLEKVGIYDGQIKGIEFLHYGGKLSWDGTGIGGNNVSFTLSQAERENVEVIWNSLNYPAGEYWIKSALNDGSKTIEREMPFRIEGVGGVTTYVNTNKPNYNTLENVYITTRIVNNSPNKSFRNLKEFITIVDSANYEYFRDSASVSLLLPAEEKEHQFVFSTGYSSSGMYKVKEVLLRDKDTLSSSTKQFYINPSGGKDIRLSGSISAVPKLVPYPDSFTVFYSLRNSGNTPIDSLPISIKITQVDENVIVYDLKDTVSLGVSGSLGRDFRFSSESLGLKPYALQLYIHPKDTTILLSVDGFMVSDLTPPFVQILSPKGLVSGEVKVNAEVSDFESGIHSVSFKVDTIIRKMNRVSGDSLKGTYESYFNSRKLQEFPYILTVTAKDYYGNSFTDSSLIEVRNEWIVPTCSSSIKPIARVLSVTDDTIFIKSILDEMNIYYKIVSKKDDFEKEFRSGIYNIYLISGNYPYLEPLTQSEITEAIFAGEGLITLTSSPCAIMPHIFEPFGVWVYGELPGKGYNIIFEDSDISDLDTISTTGKVLRMCLNGGEEIAKFEKINKKKGCGSVCLKAYYPFYSEKKSKVIIKAAKGSKTENEFVSDTFAIDSIPIFNLDNKMTEKIGNIRIDSVMERAITFSFDAEEEFDEHYTFEVEILGAKGTKKIGPSSVPLKDSEPLRKGMNFGGFEMCKVEPLCCPGYPAVVQNTYGEGKTFLFGFNPSEVTEKEELKEKIKNAILAVTPDTEKVYISKVISPVIRINTPLITKFEIKEILPLDFEKIAVLDSGEIKDYGFRWVKELTDSAEFRSILRVSDKPFSKSILITINDKDSLKIPLQGEKDVYQIIYDVIGELNSLNLNKRDRITRDQAVAELNKILKNKIKKQKDLLENIKWSIAAARLVASIKSVDCSDIRKEIDMTIKIWEAMWFKWKD